MNFKNTSNPKISNCTIVGNQYGVESNSESSPDIESTLIWDNENSFHINPGAKIIMSYSLFPNLSIPDGLQDSGNNIKGLLPEFIDQNGKNLGLQKSSPALKKGKGGSNIGAL